MTKKEIMEQIERLERAIWFEKMADFMNWTAYYDMKRELAELQRQLEKAED